MLKDSYNLLVERASRIKNFKPGTKEEFNDVQVLADCYLHAEQTNNKDMRESYISALMIRYWYMIPYLQSKSLSLKLEYDDIISWLYLGIVKALKYRGWVSDPDNTAEKCINRCLDSIRLGAFQESNNDKRKINYITYSLDESIAQFGDSADGLFVEEDNNNFNIEYLVSRKLNKKDVLSALIIDSICFNDCFTKDKFSPSKLVSGFTDRYIENFKERYETSQVTNLEIDKLVNSNELRKRVKYKLDFLKRDREVLACFMM